MNLVRISVLSFMALAACAAVAQKGVKVMTSSYTQASRENPRETLFRSMAHSQRMNVEGIVLINRYGNKSAMQCKFEQSYRGISKMTVLTPLCNQGVVMYDDGKVWKNILPDEQKMLIQPSPNPNRQLGVRQALAEQNYKFTTEQGDRVAGRATLVIVAVPKAAGMPERRYSIDVSNLYLLRVETDNRGDHRVLNDTIAVNYPSSISISDPEGDFVRQFRRIQIDPAKTVSDLKELTAMAGFKPAIPGELPFGFAVLEKQVTGDDKDVVAIRISDGLASATIFQSKEVDREGHGSRTGRRDANGIHFHLMGDLPDPITARLLEIFVREALKGLNPLLGTDLAAQLLKDLQADAGVELRIGVIFESA